MQYNPIHFLEPDRSREYSSILTNPSWILQVALYSPCHQKKAIFDLTNYPSRAYTYVHVPKSFLHKCNQNTKSIARNRFRRAPHSTRQNHNQFFVSSSKSKSCHTITSTTVPGTTTATGGWTMTCPRAGRSSASSSSWMGRCWRSGCSIRTSARSTRTFRCVC